MCLMPLSQLQLPHESHLPASNRAEKARETNRAELPTENSALVRPEGLEPPALWFEATRSIQLSYGRKEVNRVIISVYSSIVR